MAFYDDPYYAPSTAKRMLDLSEIGKKWSNKGIDLDSAMALLSKDYPFIMEHWWEFTNAQRKGFTAAVDQINKKAKTTVFERPPMPPRR